MKLAVYGTLRKGGRLHKYYMARGTQLGEAITLEGWDMYSLGWFPCVTKGEGSIVVEVYDLPKDAYDSVVRMETGAGYIMENVQTPVGKAGMCVFDNACQGREKVVDGDWLQFAADKVAA